MTANGVREAAQVLGFATPSDFVRAYPVSREWLTLLIRRLNNSLLDIAESGLAVSASRYTS